MPATWRCFKELSQTRRRARSTIIRCAKSWDGPTLLAAHVADHCSHYHHVPAWKPHRLPEALFQPFVELELHPANSESWEGWLCRRSPGSEPRKICHLAYAVCHAVRVWGNRFLTASLGQQLACVDDVIDCTPRIVAYCSCRKIAANLASPRLLPRAVTALDKLDISLILAVGRDNRAGPGLRAIKPDVPFNIFIPCGPYCDNIGKIQMAYQEKNCMRASMKSK